jgi:hypothetical protein
VVVSGSEKINYVSGRRLLGLFAAKNAVQLIKGGAYQAAKELLNDYSCDFVELAASAEVMGAWDRFAYGAALKIAKESTVWEEKVGILGKLVAAERESTLRLADMLCFVERRLGFGEAEEALAVLYRCVELAARIYFVKELKYQQEDFSADVLNADERLKVDKKFYRKLQSMESGRESLHLGMTDMYMLLSQSDFELVQSLWRKGNMWKKLQLRNETRYGHGNRVVDVETVRKLNAVVLAGIKRQWPEVARQMKQCRFPSVEQACRKELSEVTG